MKDILVSALTLGLISAVARLVLPYSKKFVALLINKLVARAERKITGSKMGAKKKEYVCKKAKVFGVKANEFLSDLIDGAVEAMNTKETSVSSALKEDITEQIENGIESASTSLKNKLSNDSEKEE